MPKINGKPEASDEKTQEKQEAPEILSPEQLLALAREGGTEKEQAECEKYEDPRRRKNEKRSIQRKYLARAIALNRRRAEAKGGEVREDPAEADTLEKSSAFYYLTKDDRVDGFLKEKAGFEDLEDALDDAAVECVRDDATDLNEEAKILLNQMRPEVRAGPIGQMVKTIDELTWQFRIDTGSPDVEALRKALTVFVRGETGGESNLHLAARTLPDSELNSFLLLVKSTGNELDMGITDEEVANAIKLTEKEAEEKNGLLNGGPAPEKKGEQTPEVGALPPQEWLEKARRAGKESEKQEYLARAIYLYNLPDDEKSGGAEEDRKGVEKLKQSKPFLLLTHRGVILDDISTLRDLDDAFEKAKVDCVFQDTVDLGLQTDEFLEKMSPEAKGSTVGEKLQKISKMANAFRTAREKDEKNYFRYLYGKQDDLRALLADLIRGETGDEPNLAYAARVFPREELKGFLTQLKSVCDALEMNVTAEELEKPLERKQEEPAPAKKPPAKKPPVQPAVRETAREYIERLQGEARELPKEVPGGDKVLEGNLKALLKAKALQIFAARVGVDSVIGKGKTLNRPRNMDKEESVMEALLDSENKSIDHWVENMPYKTLRKLVLTGHGGDLEKSYKKSLCREKHIPDGTPERFLPTVKERVEGIQATIAAVQKSAKIGARKVETEFYCELIATRSAAQVRLGGEGLKKKMTPTMVYHVENVRSDLMQDPVWADELNAASGDRKLRAMATDGHGGKFRETMKQRVEQKREQLEQQAQQKQQGEQQVFHM